MKYIMQDFASKKEKTDLMIKCICVADVALFALTAVTLTFVIWTAFL